MELKSLDRQSGVREPSRSNCTFMELKFSPCLSVRPAKMCSNCTFMELKLQKYKEIQLANDSSNCTFMELKYRVKLRNNKIRRIVLIVPLWN